MIMNIAQIDRIIIVFTMDRYEYKNKTDIDGTSRNIWPSSSIWQLFWS